MNCKGVIRELSEYIDGELEPAVKQELERHLEHCEDCKLIVNQTQKTVELYCDSVPVELPSGVRARLHEALRRKITARGN